MCQGGRKVELKLWENQVSGQQKVCTSAPYKFDRWEVVGFEALSLANEPSTSFCTSPDRDVNSHSLL